ncbi:MAG: DoxX family protein [Bacteroidia bacterium]|nr:DoxX family protein [Bacteroidia bacterium]
MKVLTWILQVLLALAMLGAGAMKLMTPVEEIVASGEHMAWAAAVPAWLVKFIGAAELTGGIGLLLPSLLRIRPKLSVLAAYGIVTIMVLAAIFHIVRGEYPAILSNVIFGGIAGFVAWARTHKVPIAAK